MKQLDSPVRHFLTKQFHFKIILILLLLCATICKTHSSFSGSQTLKPSILLILPQSFKVPTNPVQSDPDENQPQLQQYVAVINNVHNVHDNELLRRQFKKLSLQVRDATSPTTGHLYYEHVFDYFPPQSNKQHLLIPINLDQVLQNHEDQASVAARSSAPALSDLENDTQSLPQFLTVSVRPQQSEAEDDHEDETVEFVSSGPVPVEPIPNGDGRRSFGIVQTDKPVYKPEDKVRIRSLVINENLRPITKDKFSLQIKNPHKVIVDEIRFPNNEIQQHNHDPMYLDYIFDFPTEPMLGTWTVHLLHRDPIANDTTSFEVKEYVLPTFEIEFELPKYILPNAQLISGFVVAKYHHGKPVQGKAQFKFGYKESASAKPKFIARSGIKSVDPATGRVDFKISSAKFKETEWFPSISGSRLLIEATVTETATGHREVSQDASCVFISTPYKISFENSIEDFKLGLSQQLTVQVLEMQTNRPGPAGARLIAQYMDQSGTFLDVPSQVASNQAANFRQVLDTEAVTDELGYATFNVGPLHEGISTIQVTVKWTNTTHQRDEQQPMYSELAVGHHTLVKHESRNGWISFMNKSITHLNIGDVFITDLLIRDALVIPQKVFYIIVVRGQIIALENLNSDGFVKFNITESMMPSIRVVLFALTRDSVGFLSDSLRINIAQDLNCGLSMQYKSHSANTGLTFRPSDKGKLAIKARQGDLVSIIGVESAVCTINNRSRLDSSKIIQRIKRLDTGCGFGGGKNNLDVFQNAGLMFFKDAYNSNPDEPYLGSACLTVQNQLKHIDDIQHGYSRPMFIAAAKLNRPRVLDIVSRGRTPTVRSRSKREIDVGSILNRYKNSLDRSCCYLGTLEDIPQRRNCSVRSRIVEKYFRQSEHQSCAKIYFDCCTAVFGDYLLLGSLLSSRSSAEPVMETKILPTYYTPQFSEAVVLTNVGHLDRIEMETLTRKDFRETWLFELVTVEQPDGTASLDTQLPHSITTWAVSAMALNKYQPMCLMPQPLKITTFQEIFLHVSMPYKVIQGEQIDLVATIFNYSPIEQEIFVYMYGVEDICSEAEPGERSDRKRLRLDKYSSQSAVFLMIPLKIGKFFIKILAITSTSNSSDIVERELNVISRDRPVTDETFSSLDPINQQRRKRAGLGISAIPFQEEDELCRFNIDSSIDEWQPKVHIPHSKLSNPEDFRDTKIIEDSASSNIEDEYFKTFDKSMLSELNLVNYNQQLHKEFKQHSSAEKVSSSRVILRTRRLASHMIDFSKKESSPTQDSWATKIISSLKASLPSWLIPNGNSRQHFTTTTSPASPDLGTIQTASLIATTPTKKTNTSRRSTEASAVVSTSTVLSGTIPAGARLNPLSKQIELGQNETQPSFNELQVTQQIAEHPSNRLVLLLQICVHHLSRRDSEMAVIEVGIISGFKPNVADLGEIVHDTNTPVIKYELSADKSLVLIYLQHIPFSGPYCMQFRLVRDSMVYNLQSGYVRAYEYYSPAYSCSNFYTPSRVSDLIETKCDSSGQVCKCATKSFCPATNKLLNLGEVHSVNATSARTQLMEMICSNRFDLVSLVRLKNVRYLEGPKMYKLSVKVKSDLKGNLTKIMNLQHQQRSQRTSSPLKPSLTIIPIINNSTDPLESIEEDNTSLDYLSLNIDSTCVPNDPFLLHLAHPNQWKQGGELMILFARLDGLEKRLFRTLAKSSGPKPKATIIEGITDGLQENVQIVDAQPIQYSLALQLDKDSILHDLTYQAKSEPRATINNLILWLELRSRREKWTCRSTEISSKL